MQTTFVHCKHASYPVYVGDGLLAQRELIRQHIVGQQVLLVSNETVAPLYLSRLTSCLTGLATHHVILPDGEQFKTWQGLTPIFDALLTAGHHRSTTLIALGGGVVGDMTGFAAACYQRGVDYIQVPTSLLAQVDAAVGGKTAVNHHLGKNMMGAFHQPKAVLVDTATLRTLPLREYTAGLAEVIKHAVVADVDFFRWLQLRLNQESALSPADLETMIVRAVQIKAKIVASDEREQGARALLNFGHTFAHALEAATSYRQYLHGEAVAIGMVLAGELSVRLGHLNEGELTLLVRLLLQAGLPTRLPQGLAVENLLKLMKYDKKTSDTALRLVSLTGLGQAVVTAVDENLVKQVLDRGAK